MVGFGEIALLLNDRRKASVYANTDVECWVLPNQVFKLIVQKNITNRRCINLQYLSQIPLLSTLEAYEKLKLIDGLQVQYQWKG